MTNGSGVSRGDRNRNARLSRLRSAVPVANAIVGIDLADRKQMVVVCDHDSRVLARKTEGADMAPNYPHVRRDWLIREATFRPSGAGSWLLELEQLACRSSRSAAGVRLRRRDPVPVSRSFRNGGSLGRCGFR